MKIAKYMSAIIMMLLLVAVPINAQTTDDDVVKSMPYVTITEVKINGDTAQNGDELYIERGDSIELRITLEGGSYDAENMYMGAFLSGYRYAQYERDLVTDFTKTFDLPAGKKRSFDLNLKVPVDMVTEDAKVRLILFDMNSASVIIYNYQLSIYGADEKGAIQIRDFFISPSTTIEAGRALSFKVKVKNYGQYVLDDVKVHVSIPELNLHVYETIDQIDPEETESFEALLLRIPADAKAGTYEVVATVEFDRFQSTKETKLIQVTGSATAPSKDEGKSIITMPESVDVMLGSQGSIYPVLIQNKGETSRTYVLSVSGVSDWGAATFEPSSVVVVKAGQSQTVYLRVAPAEKAEAGDKIFRVSVTSGDETTETNVMASLKGEAKSGTDMRNVLEWVLIVLIVVLIVLGLIVVFTKMRRKNNEDDEEQTYY